MGNAGRNLRVNEEKFERNSNYRENKMGNCYLQLIVQIPLGQSPNKDLTSF